MMAASSSTQLYSLVTSRFITQSKHGWKGGKERGGEGGRRQRKKRLKLLRISQVLGNVSVGEKTFFYTVFSMQIYRKLAVPSHAMLWPSVAVQRESELF